MKYPQDFINRLICIDSLEGMKNIPDNSVDLMPTDPPYGYSFMGRDWDKALVSIRTWKECLRVLKPGGFAFIMCAPRQDVLSRQIINLEEAGFITGFSSIYWAYASGFPKAQDISKMIDKKECIKQLTEKLGRKPTKKEFSREWKNFRKVKGYKSNIYPDGGAWGRESSLSYGFRTGYVNERLNKEPFGFTPIEEPATPQARAFNGSYGGFQPKPAIEVILVVMKPLSEKTYTDQALRDGKGITWLDKGRIPLQGIEEHRTEAKWRPEIYSGGYKGGESNSPDIKRYNNQGRFPANLLVSDDVLNNGKISRSGKNRKSNQLQKNQWLKKSIYYDNLNYGDSGSFSRYFDLDKWWEKKIKQLPEAAQRTFPFLIVPKASRSEKNRGCERLEEKVRANINKMMGEAGNFKTGSGNDRTTKFKNHHPTVKPIQLMSYLIILGSRPNDIILDPFVGSGTTCIAAKILGRRYIGIDDNRGYVEIAQCRLREVEPVLI